jgi:hypothetical protein
MATAKTSHPWSKSPSRNCSPDAIRTFALTPKNVARTPKNVARTPKNVARTPKNVARTPKNVVRTPTSETQSVKATSSHSVLRYSNTASLSASLSSSG